MKNGNWKILGENRSVPAVSRFLTTSRLKFKLLWNFNSGANYVRLGDGLPGPAYLAGFSSIFSRGRYIASFAIFEKSPLL